MFSTCRWRVADSVVMQEECIVYRRLPPHHVFVLRLSATRLVYLGMTCECVQRTETGPYWPVQAECAFALT